MYTLSEINEGTAAGDCSGWERDPQSFAKRVADHYLRTVLNQSLMARTIRPPQAGSVRWEVMYLNDIVIAVIFAKGFVAAARIHPWGPIRHYDYSCTPQGDVVLVDRTPPAGASGGASATRGGLPAALAMRGAGNLRGYGFGQAPTAPSARPTVVLDRFDFDQSTVKPTHWPGTLSVARTILASEGTASPIRTVRLVGHTDRTGTETYNQQLGQRRAEAVQRYLRDTLNRMRPGSGARITFSTESRGETQPVTGTADLSRRVEVFLPSPPPPQDTRPRCANVANAAAIERAAARQTLSKSVGVANRFIRMLGGLDARGRFSPTVLDDKYWFAKLYELITYFEILRIDGLQHPGFLLHFIPVFYNMYSDALDDFQNNNLGRVSALWRLHFTTAGRPSVGSFSDWQRGVQNSIVTGVSAHIRGDMATALERAYRSYVAKYCLTNVPFDTFRTDFFERNRPVFNEVQASFFLELSRRGPFPVRPEVGQAIIGVGAQVSGGLDLDEVFRWRATAWAEAKRRLGQ
jgi:hypothetical protein